MPQSHNRSRALKALDIAGMDALIAGIMAIALASLFAWATKEGSTFSQETWTQPFVLRIPWRGVVLGALVGGIFGSIIRPSWGPLTPTIGSIGFWGILEAKPTFPRVVFCLGFSLIYGLISFSNNFSAKPEQAAGLQSSEAQAPGNAGPATRPLQDNPDAAGPKEPES